MTDKWLSPVRAAAIVGLLVGLGGIGLLSLIHHDFALQWEPVPASWPHRDLMTTASGLILLAAAVMLALPRARVWGAALAAGFVGLWALGLQLPKALAHPRDLTIWLAVAECAAMSLGALVLFEDSRGGKGALTGVAIRLFGLAAVMFGVSHFAFAKFTASMVPAWLPAHLALAYATGAVHALTGLALVLRRWVRPAAALEAAMMTSFVVLVHVPRVAAAPASRLEETLLLVALTLSSAAWIVATTRKA